MTIPTLADYMDLVQCRMEGAIDGQDEEIVTSLSQVFTTTTASETDLFNSIAYSQGCHALAEAYRIRGDRDNAGLFHAMGQDLLGKAIDALAALMAIGIQQLGVVRH